MAGMTAPQSPQHERWETIWHYMQSGPGVFKGDLFIILTTETFEIQMLVI